GSQHFRPGQARSRSRAPTSETRRPEPGQTPTRSVLPAGPARHFLRVRSPTSPLGPALASRAAIGRPVHELFPDQGWAARRARFALPRVDGKGGREVAALPVPVDVGGVERGSAGFYGFSEALADSGQQALTPRAAQPVRSARPVHPGPPQRLVG